MIIESFLGITKGGVITIYYHEDLSYKTTRTIRKIIELVRDLRDGRK